MEPLLASIKSMPPFVGQTSSTGQDGGIFLVRKTGYRQARQRCLYRTNNS